MNGHGKIKVGKGSNTLRRPQRRRIVWGACMVILLVAIFSGLFFEAFRTSDPISGEHVDTVDWLPQSATDINYYKRDGFGWIKNYDCFIPEEDFLSLAIKEGWKLQQEGNVFFYEKRHPNGGGISVNYDRDSKRLSVKSNHR